MVVHFKNSSFVIISQEYADIISQRIFEGAKKFQVFLDQNGKALLLINLEEVTHID